LTLFLFFLLVQDAKFGYGGKKKWLKSNTAESAADMSQFRSSKHSKGPAPPKRFGGQGAKGSKRFGGLGSKSQPKVKRLGKSRRQKMKLKR
jgi:hypothetical protein